MASEHYCKGAKGKATWRKGSVDECPKPQNHGRKVKNQIPVKGANASLPAGY